MRVVLSGQPEAGRVVDDESRFDKGRTGPGRGAHPVKPPGSVTIEPSPNLCPRMILSRPRCGLLALLLALWGLSATAVAESELVSLTHPDQADSPVDRQFLRLAYMKRLQTWPDGTPIVLFTLPDRAPEHQAFCLEQLGVYPYVLRSIWDRQVFTGTGDGPRTVGSLAEMRAAIGRTRGGLGYGLKSAHAGGAGSPANWSLVDEN